MTEPTTNDPKEGTNVIECRECQQQFKPKGRRTVCYTCRPAVPRAHQPPSDGSLYNRGTSADPLWWGRLHFKGRDVRFAIGRMTKKAAKDVLRQKRADLSQGIHLPGDESKVTLSDLVDAVRRDYRDQQFRSASTAMIICRHLMVYFGEPIAVRTKDLTWDDLIKAGRNCPLRSVDFHAIVNYREHRLKDVSPQTVNRETAMLRKGFGLLVKNKRITRPPDFPEPFAESQPRQGFVDLSAMLTIKNELPAHLQDPWEFSFWSAWRRGEVFRLRWDWVDLDANEIRLPATASKNKAGRVLPIFPQLREVLVRRKEAQVPFCQHVFHRNGQPLGHDVHHTMAAAAARAGHPGTLWHDLRRSGIRNLVRAGVSQKVAMAWSGHRTDATFRRYDITSTDDLHNAAAKLADYMDGQPSVAKRKVTSIRSAVDKRRKTR